jgi:hypothetical protein
MEKVFTAETRSSQRKCIYISDERAEIYHLPLSDMASRAKGLSTSVDIIWFPASHRKPKIILNPPEAVISL